MKFVARYSKNLDDFAVFSAPNQTMALKEAVYYRTDAVVYPYDAKVLSFKDVQTKRFNEVKVDDRNRSDRMFTYELLLGDEVTQTITAHELEVEKVLNTMSFTCYDEKGKEKLVHGRNGVIITLAGMKLPVFAKKIKNSMFPIRAVRKIERKDEPLRLEGTHQHEDI
jgi:hypothetical protein